MESSGMTTGATSDITGASRPGPWPVEVVRLARPLTPSEFVALAPAGSIAIDGAVVGPSWITANHANIDHHADCARAATLASCEQTAELAETGALSRLTRSGTRPLRIHVVGDVDGDVVLTVWVCRHPDLLSHPRVRRLLAFEGFVDRHFGLVVPDWARHQLGLFAWVFAPVHGHRGSDDPDELLAAGLTRMSDYVNGATGHVPLGGFSTLARNGRVALIEEHGPLPRPGLRAAGIDVFVSATGSRVTIGTTHPFTGVDLAAIFGHLNNQQGWQSIGGFGGSDRVGGSRRPVDDPHAVFAAVVNMVNR